MIPRLVDVLAWANCHVDAMRDRFGDSCHVLRAELIRDGIKQLSERGDQAMKDLELLGLKVRDRVTGMLGVVSCISYDLYGCVQAVVTPPVDEKGSLPEGKWFDVSRLEVLDRAPVMEIPGGRFTVERTIAAAGNYPGPAEKPAR